MKKIAQHLAGFEPTTTRVLLPRRVRYHFATTATANSYFTTLTSWRLPNQTLVGEKNQLLCAR